MTVIGGFPRLAGFGLLGLFLVSVLLGFPAWLPSRRDAVLRELDPYVGGGVGSARQRMYVRIVLRWRSIVCLSMVLLVAGTVLRAAG